MPYVCAELDETSANGDGFAYAGSSNIVHCKTWQKLDDQPFLSSITKEQANELTVALLSVILLAFGWFLFIKLVREFR